MNFTTDISLFNKKYSFLILRTNLFLAPYELLLVKTSLKAKKEFKSFN